MEKEYVNNKVVQSILQYGTKNNFGKPKVSVVMPIFNRPYYFRLALESVLCQDTQEEYEIIVVDNSPIDNNENLNIVVEFGSNKVFYYHNEENLGMYGNFNRGVELSRAPYVTFCHDDDLFVPSTLSCLLKNSVEGKLIITLHCNINDKGIIIYNPQWPSSLFGKKRKPYTEYPLSLLFFRTEGMGGGGMLFTRDNLIRIGGFNMDFYPSTDYELICNYVKRFGGVFLPEVTYKYRVARNTSSEVYKLFPAQDMRIRESLYPHINCPTCILRWINNAKTNASIKALPVVWANKKQPLTFKFFMEKVIVKLCFYYSYLRLSASLFF